MRDKNRKMERERERERKSIKTNRSYLHRNPKTADFLSAQHRQENNAMLDGKNQEKITCLWKILMAVYPLIAAPRKILIL